METKVVSEGIVKKEVLEADVSSSSFPLSSPPPPPPEQPLIKYQLLTEEQLLLPLSILLDQKVTKFPGALPVSLDRQNLHTLRYGVVASLKADGERVFCFVTANRLVLMRRNNQFKSIPLLTPFSEEYIFDCEYIRELHLLLIFDTLLFANQPSWRLDYLQRVELALHFLSMCIPASERCVLDQGYVQDPKPLPSAYSYGTTWNMNGLMVQVKPPYAPDTVKTLWKHRHHVRYACDGIIFSRLWCTYRPFSDTVCSILKWKPCVTLDFVVRFCESNNQPILLRLPPLSAHASLRSHSTDDSLVAPASAFNIFSHPSDELRRNVLLEAAMERRVGR